MRPLYVVLTGSLALILGLQLMYWSQERAARSYEDIPVTGGMLPHVSVATQELATSLHLPNLVTRRGSCALLVAMSTTCGFCRSMRMTWPTRFASWADSVGVLVSSFWVFEESWETIGAFLNGYDTGPTEAIQALPGRTSAFQSLGVIGTPMVYLTDAAGVLRYGIVGDRFPPAHFTAHVCRVSA